MEDNTLARDRFSALFKALSPPVSLPPPNLPQALQALPEPYLLPSPWATWLLVALVRYRERQDWVKQVVQHYAPQAIPPSPEFMAQEQPVSLDLTADGVWPSQVELECHCDFGRATDSISGETITFGLSQRTEGICFDDTFIHSTGALMPQEPETRFRELHPSQLSIWYAINDLEAAGLLEGIYFDERHADFGVAPDAHCLSDAALWHLLLIQRFCDRLAR